MSGSTAAPFYGLPYTPAMNSHLVDTSYSASDNNTYLTNSMGAGPSTQPSGNVNGENTPGSTKRPFPWASSESERDKRPRSGSGTAAVTDDAEETMSTDESAYASAAESPNPHFSRSPTRVDWPLSVVDESETRAAASAPRIPTPAALRSSSPLQLPNLPIQSGFRPVSATTATSNPPLRLSLAPRPPTNNVSTSEPRTQPLDLGWLTQQLDEALPPPRDRAFSLSFGSASVDSALPLPQHSRAGSTRVPLPWVDIEGDSSLLGPGSESLSASLGPESSLGLGDSASSPGVASTVRSDDSPPTNSPPNATTHSPPTATTTRRPLSLNLRNFPLATSPDSPSTAFPASASPRTSAFDLAVTPPGSALPSFVARMMEVDSPVHSGGDSYISSQAEAYVPSPSRAEAYTSAAQAEAYLPSAPQSGGYIASQPQAESYVPSQPQTQAYASSSPQTEDGDASIEALRRFMRQEEANGEEFVRQEEGNGFVRQEQGNEFTHQNEGNGFAHQDRDNGFTHQSGDNGFVHQQGGAGLLHQNEVESMRSNASPNQAPTGVAVGSYFPVLEPHERQEVPRVPPPMGGHFEQPRSSHEPVSRSNHEQARERPARASFTEQSSRPSHPSEDSATNTMGSVYSRRLTESGVSFPSRPSDSGSSLPSFRATVSPEPGRMSWSDLFGPRSPETPDTGLSTRGSEATMSMRGSEISVGTRMSEATMSTRTDIMASARISEVSVDTRASEATTGMRTSEANASTGMSTRADARMGTRGAYTGMAMRADIGTSTTRAGVRSALTRAVRLGGPEGPPRLHLDALPREDRTSATNLSRTPPGPDSHPTVWFEDNASRPRRTSSTRWTDLFPEPAAAPVPIAPRPTNRSRMPPPVSVSSTDSTVFDPLTRMSWNRNSQALPDPPTTTYDTAASLARYQTFAQSIDEIRRSPPPPQHTESTGWGGAGSNRSSWAFPRHEPPQYEPHQPQTDGNWLREWESQRDQRSREAREDYIRRRDTDYTNNDRRHNTEYAGNDEAPRPPPVAQLNDTQAVWPDFVGRPRSHLRPMTRASLVATGFADSDLWPESDGTNNRFWGEIPPRPSRRAEVLPARADDVDTPMQFLPNTHEGGIFTESPPSLLEDFNDPGPYSESISGIAQPPRPDPVSFRSASRVLRASLVDTSRRASDGPSRPVPAESERTRVSSRDRWEPQLSRSQAQLERVRQLLHRSNDSRDREASRRHPPDPPTQPHRRSFLSVLGNEISSSTISSDSRRSSMSVSTVAWPRPGATEAPPPRPFPLHEGDRPEWPPSDTSSRNNTLTHELMRASSLRGRRRQTLLPESASRRDSTGFLHSVNNALHQVESGLLHINQELNALADEGDHHTRRYGPQNEPEPAQPHTPSRPGPHMDWALEPTQRNPTPPPTLPQFEFASAQRSSGWPAERYNHPYGETSSLGLELPIEYPTRRTPTRGPEALYEQRQSVRDSSSTRGTRPSSYAHNGSWRSSGPSNEWLNDASSPSLLHIPPRDPFLPPSSGSGHQSVAASRQPEPVNGRSNSMGSSMQAQPPSAAFGRLHRRRLSPPAAPHQPSVSSSLLRPFANQNSSTSPTRSYASRFSHFLPRRNSGRGGGSSDDNDEWHHAEQATRRFFLRPRGRGRPPAPSGDFIRDDEFDDSYEGLLRLAARIGDAKPRGTPSEVIRSMLSCRYADSDGARAEARCSICLDDYAPDDIVTVVKRCSHWFHRECVQVSSKFLVCIRTKADQ
ncbi:unnamed protein product [Rhizoctonia solani]|uniref:RING-type domain-containing protein n=1 Tax=Rhizoctonia solani TaxID=456999 RepID=A0A8H2X2H1_9AGAM|nr:unnamed protein product [Rhizoctonia solani]